MNWGVIGTACAFLLLGLVLGYTAAPTAPSAKGLQTVACEAATGYAAKRARDWLTQDEEDAE